MGIVSYHLAGMSDQDLRYLHGDIDRQLRDRDNERHRQTERELHQLGLVVAQYMGCSKGELNSRGRELSREEQAARERQREKDLAGARAAVERGEISDVSEYIPF